MISFTGSTRAGILVAKNAADTVKRVHQELGGKSPNVILPGTPLDMALPGRLLRRPAQFGAELHRADPPARPPFAI